MLRKASLLDRFRQFNANAVATLTIGQAEGLGFLDGRLDEIRLYSDALSASQIAALATVPEPGSVALLSIGMIGLMIGSHKTFGLARRRRRSLQRPFSNILRSATTAIWRTLERRAHRVACGFAACGLLLFALSANAVLIHQWTFNDTNDATPDDIITGQSGTLYNGATVVTDDGQGLLQLDGVDDYFRSATLSSPNIDAKTLVVWLRLDNLSQRAGGALTLEDYTTPSNDLFDAIVYAESTPNQWRGGSDNSLRSPLANNGGAAETLVDPNEVMIAISYSGGGSQTVSLYRNGSAYASYVTGTQTFTSSFVDALIGLRHEHNSGNFGTATGTDAFLAALVNEARIYDTALTASEISDLYAAGPLAIPEPRGLSLLLLACAAATAAIRARTT